ncbi:hypothetical protein Syun_013017 [Stephania yunnanensis]|uniref:Uncharacterized protein n=1 Tax=Stephania yunnanensis TaxID=152371 RepID=A0AAP0PGX7_9MAGN
MNLMSIKLLITPKKMIWTCYCLNLKKTYPYSNNNANYRSYSSKIYALNHLIEYFNQKKNEPKPILNMFFMDS